MGVRLRRIVPYRLRILLRAAFLLLALATIALAVSVLQQEKQLSYTNYQSSFRKTGEQIAATLRHPSGHLALLNPGAGRRSRAALRPLLLPFRRLDFDDLQKVQQAVAMSGCLRQYGDSGSLCAGVGSNPWAGGFIYLAGSVDSRAAGVAPQRRRSAAPGAPCCKVSVTLRGRDLPLDRALRGRARTPSRRQPQCAADRAANRLPCGRRGAKQYPPGTRLSRLDVAKRRLQSRTGRRSADTACATHFFRAPAGQRLARGLVRAGAPGMAAS